MDRFSVAILVFLAAAWVLQIWFSSRQMRQFHADSQVLRKRGDLMAIGRGGGLYRGRAYGVVVNRGEEVAAAGLLTGATVIAKLREEPRLEGMAVRSLGKGERPEYLSEKEWSALGNAAEFIIPKLPSAPEESEAEA